MSQASAYAFLDKLEGDTALRLSWQKALCEAVQVAMVAMANSHGYRFTAEELGRALSEHEHAFSDDHLATSAEGLNPPSEPRIPMAHVRKLIDFGLTLPRF